MTDTLLLLFNELKQEHFKSTLSIVENRDGSRLDWSLNCAWMSSTLGNLNYSTENKGL